MKTLTMQIFATTPALAQVLLSYSNRRLNDTYWPRITGDVRIHRAMADLVGTDNNASFSISSVSLANQDGALTAALSDNSVIGAKVVFASGTEDADVGDLVPLPQTFQVLSVEIGVMIEIGLTADDPVNVKAPTNRIQPPRASAGETFPAIFGRVHNVSGKPRETTLLADFISDGECRFVLDAFDNGRLLNRQLEWGFNATNDDDRHFGGTSLIAHNAINLTWTGGGKWTGGAMPKRVSGSPDDAATAAQYFVPGDTFDVAIAISDYSGAGTLQLSWGGATLDITSHSTLNTTVGQITPIKGYTVKLTSVGNFVGQVGLFNLIRRPNGQITYTADGQSNADPALETNRLESIFQAMLVDYAGLSAASIDASDLAALNYASCGTAAFEQQNLREWLSSLLPTGWWHGTRRDGKYEGRVLKAPVSGATPDTVVTRVVGTPKLTVQPDIYHAVHVGYRRNWTPLSTTDKLLDRGDRNYFTKDFALTASAENATIHVAHPSSTEVTLESAIEEATAAQAEADRQLALFGEQRFTLKIDTQEPDFVNDLGDQLRVVMPQLGHDVGIDYRLADYEYSLIYDDQNLVLWR